ncbi:hypothetical protein ILYODFUR_008532, partial [Ilyodon furcidens]
MCWSPVDKEAENRNIKERVIEGDISVLIGPCNGLVTLGGREGRMDGRKDRHSVSPQGLVSCM